MLCFAFYKQDKDMSELFGSLHDVNFEHSCIVRTKSSYRLPWAQLRYTTKVV